MTAYLLARSLAPNTPEIPEAPAPPPVPPPAPPVPAFAPEAPASEEEAKTRRRERRRTGVESTVRTSPLGIPSTAALGLPVRARGGGG